MSEEREIELINLAEHVNDTFLVGGYRREQAKWIFGKKPNRDFYLYNTRFAIEEKCCRDGSMGTGELPGFIVLYD